MNRHDANADAETEFDREPADRLVDEVIPDEVEWERLTRRYPLAALLVAAVGGFVLGRSRGPEILDALSSFAGRRVAASVNELLGEEVLD